MKHRYFTCKAGPYPHSNKASNLDHLLASITTPILGIHRAMIQPTVGLKAVPGWLVKTMVPR